MPAHDEAKRRRARGPSWWPASLLIGLLLAMLAGCNNSPWPRGAELENTLYTAMSESTPRHLDPTASYWSNDTLVTYQVYEPPYGYHYLKRPFELVPKSAERVVSPIYLDKDERGIWVYDQWQGQPVHRRLIRFEGGTGAKRGFKSNDGRRFAVIE